MMIYNFGFTGHHFHKKSGLVLTLYRAYDPILGRWLSTDPIREAGGLNLYGYVINDPINYWDPYGLIFTYKGNGGDKDWENKTGRDLKKVERDLNNAAKNGCEQAKNDLADFNSLKNDPNYNVDIKPVSTGTGNSYNYKSNHVNYDAYNPNGGKDSSGSTNGDASVGLGHEIGHAIDDYNGGLPGNIKCPANDPSRFPNKAEENAVGFENSVRKGRWPGDKSRQRPKY